MNATLFSLLAQTQVQLPESGMAQCLRSGQLPSRAGYITDMVQLHEFWAVLLIVAGIVYLLSGWKVFKAYKGRTTPSTFLIDKTGKVRFYHRNFNEGMEKTFKREIEALLDETA